MTEWIRPEPALLRQDMEGNLLCPACGADTTHIEAVTAKDSTGGSTTVTARGEDAHGRITVASPGQRISTEGSSRRQSFTLHLSCEQCVIESDITFAQHKGATRVQIGYTEAEQE